MSGPEVQTLLGGRVRLLPAPGLKPTTDTVLLAAATPAGEGDRVLDAGCGSGAAALCLAARVPGCTVVGLEREPELAAIARENVALNGMDDRVTIVEGDLMALPPGLDAASFDRVMTNPPYLDPRRSRGSPDRLRRAAMVESAPLDQWLAVCLLLLKPGGDLVVVHRAERDIDIVMALGKDNGAVWTLFIVPERQARSEPRRLLMRAQRSAPCAQRFAEPLLLHGSGGAYTPNAEAILRHGEALPWLEIGGGDPT